MSRTMLYNALRASMILFPDLDTLTYKTQRFQKLSLPRQYQLLGFEAAPRRFVRGGLESKPHR